MKITDCPIITHSITLAVMALLLSEGNGYRIVKIIKSRCTVHDPVTVQNVSCWSKSINRTYSVANVRANITRALNNIMVNFGIFRKAEIKYRPFLVNITDDYCAFFSKNRASKYLRIMAPIYLPYSNLNHSCPYKGEVIVKDVPLHLHSLPSITPSGEYRLDVVCFEAQQKLLTMEFFTEITDNGILRRDY